MSERDRPEFASIENEIAYFIHAWECGIETGNAEFDNLTLCTDFAKFILKTISARGFHGCNPDLP